MNLAVGTSLQNGKYVLSHLLEQRGVSLIFRACQAAQQPSVLVQTLNQEVVPAATLASTQQKFLRIVQHVAQADQPNLVNVLDWFVDADRPFLVMRQVAGQTLADWVKAMGALPESSAVAIVGQIGAALSALHQQDVVHGSLTPHRIRHLANTDQVVLADLGLSHPALLGVPVRVSTTTEYAAIETVQPQAQLTPATDVYALAAIFYWLVTGQSPLPATRRSETSLISPRQLVPHLSSMSETAILQGMQMSPHDRPATIAAWLDLIGLPPLATPALGGVVPQRMSLPSPVSLPALSLDGPVTTLPTAQAFPPAAMPAIADSPHSPMRQMTYQKSRFLSPTFWRRAAVIAALTGGIGVSTGLIFRVAGTSTGPGATLFHMDQSFPSQQAWPIMASPVSEPITPAIKEVPVQEHWQPESPPASQAEKVAESPTPTAAPLSKSTATSPEPGVSPTVSPSVVAPELPAAPSAQEIPADPIPEPAAPASVATPEVITPPTVSEPVAPPAADSPNPTPVGQ